MSLYECKEEAGWHQCIPLWRYWELGLTAPVDFNDTVPALSYEIKYAEVPASVSSSFTVSTVSNLYKD